MSGFALRVPDHILAQAKAAAAEDDVSINQLLVALIAEGLGHRRGLRDLRKRAARADIKSAMSILDRVPDMPPDEGRRTAGTAPNPGLTGQQSVGYGAHFPPPNCSAAPPRRCRPPRR